MNEPTFLLNYDFVFIFSFPGEEIIQYTFGDHLLHFFNFSYFNRNTFRRNKNKEKKRRKKGSSMACRVAWVELSIAKPSHERCMNHRRPPIDERRRYITRVHSTRVEASKAFPLFLNTQKCILIVLYLPTRKMGDALAELEQILRSSEVSSFPIPPFPSHLLFLY